MSLSDFEDGIVIRVKINPNAKKNEIKDWESGFLKITVTAPPERGKANEAVIDLLSKTFKIPKKNIKLVKGEKSRIKLFYLIGISKEKFENDLII